MIRKTTRPVAFGLVVCTFVCAVVGAAEHTRDSLDTVKEKLKSNEAVLIDVREKEEWDDGHIKDAKFSPLSELKDDSKLEKLLKQFPKDKVVYCHCRSGGRCLTAADILKKKGYDVRPLKPGYNDLVKSGFEKAEGK